MEIELAKQYGFCFGVKRAIKIAEQHQNSYTFGPLIHNRLEIERLKNQFNVGLKEDIREFKKGDKLIIRTHGIEKKNLQYLKEQNIEFIDATCPFVKKPQEIVQNMSREGYDIVIFGDKNHPEIKGVKSYAEHGAYVVLEVEELENIALSDRIALVAQTTRKIEDFKKIASYLIEKYKEVRVFNTICNATFENQISARELAKKADIMIIIGGKNSSNTKQLVRICEEVCDSCYHIESEEEVEPGWFENRKLCGITAGASTPDWIIERVKKRIEELN
ncbi:MAG TPA: 4-hydroxy-3-methylbut-2-enyl diphosphate reductase [Campylobacterales bacterium]|nr:4-hydroxy-3-methylbut-2-enyl diphosphate reductase [Campylobacterales bacterium]HIO71120.1 4-hydroxy-3-methylbut-2-enyl diphosphate reductase [Campylobacterales bacterium]